MYKSIGFNVSFAAPKKHQCSVTTDNSILHRARYSRKESTTPETYNYYTVLKMDKLINTFHDVTVNSPQNHTTNLQQSHCERNVRIVVRPKYRTRRVQLRGFYGDSDVVTVTSRLEGRLRSLRDVLSHFGLSYGAFVQLVQFGVFSERSRQANLKLQAAMGAHQV